MKYISIVVAISILFLTSVVLKPEPISLLRTLFICFAMTFLVLNLPYLQKFFKSKTLASTLGLLGLVSMLLSTIFFIYIRIFIR